MKVRLFLCLGIFTFAAIGAVKNIDVVSGIIVSAKSAPAPVPVPSITPDKGLTDAERRIEERELNQKSIRVDTPEVFDDAMLQQMLQEAETRLAALQAFEQTSLKFGAVSGATQQISSFGLNIQGPSIPGSTITNKGATGSTEQTSTGTTTKTGQPTEDVSTTIPQFNPPTAVAPSASTTLPSNPTVAASRILNEQAQLSAQIQMLRLLLRGSLSSQFILPDPNGNGQISKLKTTLGIPVTITPNKDYKNAVAIVEVEVKKKSDIGGGKLTCSNSPETNAEKGPTLECYNSVVKKEAPIICNKLAAPDAIGEYGCSTSLQLFKCNAKSEDDITCDQGNGGEPPMITALLPQEKTYNVAAIKERNTSIGGGVATQIVGVSGSWLSGRKTYFLVQDQDTVALAFKPQKDPKDPKDDPNDKVGFLWQFRPVLGQQYVLSERKYVFVQLAFPSPPRARSGQIGTVKIKTYWRKYDYKRGIVGGIIPGSLREDDISDWDIPRFSENPTFAFNNNNLENLGGGKMLVTIGGKFLPGTTIKIGENTVAPKIDYTFLRFTATTVDLATKKVFLIAPNGEETRLIITHWKDAATRREAPATSNVKIETADESNSKISMDLNDAVYLKENLVIVAGGRVFKPSNSGGNTLTSIVPTASLVESPSVTLTSLLAPDYWAVNVPIPNLDTSSRNERMVVMEQKGNEVKFLLYGNRLGSLTVVKPDQGATVESLIPSENNNIRIVKMTKDAVQENKFLILRRGNERPFTITIPSIELKEKKPEPKMLERVLTNADEAIVEGINSSDLEKVTFRGTDIPFEKSEDIEGVRLKGLRTNNVTTGTASIQPLVFLFKSGVKVTVKLEVVSTKVENIPK